jgi:transmembrane sensor
MTETNSRMMVLISRHAEGEKLTEQQLTAIRQWCNASEEHLIIYQVLTERPWLREDSRNAADVPARAIRKALSKEIKKINRPKGGAATGRWLILFAALVLSASIVFVLVKSKHAPSPAEYAGQKSSPAHKIDDPTVLRLADGRLIALDTVAHGSSIVLSDMISLVVKTEDSLLVVGQATDRAELVYSLTVGAHHKPLNIAFHDGGRMQLSPAAEFALSSHRDKNSLRKGKARLEVAKNANHPFVVTLPDGTKVEDMGTSFEIDATNTREPKIALASGRVRVTGTAGAVEMTPKDRVTVRNGLPVKSLPATDTALWGWAHQPMTMRFEHASIGKVASALSQYYGLTLAKTGSLAAKGDLTITINTSDGLNKNKEKIKEHLGDLITITKDSLIIRP